MKKHLFTSVCIAFGFAATAQTPTAYTTKYDFVPGEKIIAYEDFSATEIGDFPLKWKTNATAEVVTVNGKRGKWMKINKESVFYPEFIKDLPENFTLEFDLGVNQKWDSSPFVINITNLSDPKLYTDYYHYVNWKGTHSLHMQIRPAIIDQRAGFARLQTATVGNYLVDSDIEFKSWDNGPTNFAHVALWRQGQRLRGYVNGEKVWDVQEVFDPKSKYNAITFAQQGSYNLDDYLLISNIRLAAGAPDTRNKLAKGKFVTTGILFDPNSDVIQPESYGTLKAIAAVLKDSAYKVKIVGHTDADGEAAANLELSKQRAAAVKAYLVNNFGLVAENIEVTGMGEANPIDVNTTLAGKANNRRVEFISLPITVKGLPITVKPDPNLPITVKPGGKN